MSASDPQELPWHALGLHGMAKGFRDMADNPDAATLSPAEWLDILLERESTLRQQKPFESRAKSAKLRHVATVKDIDFRAPRGLDRTMFLKVDTPSCCSNSPGSTC